MYTYLWQVRKWMSNKRMRTGNTLPFNGSLHPKKLQKLVQMRDEYSHMAATMAAMVVDPQRDAGMTMAAMAMDPQRDAGMTSPQGKLTIMTTTPSPSGKRRRKGVERAKRLLEPHAVDTMNTWYREHMDYPYPTDVEKREIAESTGITISQVREGCRYCLGADCKEEFIRIETKCYYNLYNNSLE